MQCSNMGRPCSVNCAEVQRNGAVFTPSLREVLAAESLRQLLGEILTRFSL